MKYITLLLLGVVSANQSESNAIANLSNQNKLYALEAESDSDSSDDEHSMVQTGVEGDDGIIDAMGPAKGSCEERLWMSEDEMQW